MINDMQRILYKLSCVAPMIIFVGISLYIQDFDSKKCILLIIVGVILSIYVFFFIWLCKRDLPTITVTVESVASNDMVALVYIVTYLVPLVGVIWSNDSMTWMVISIIAVIFLLKMHIMNFCPILLLCGYHCFRVNLTTGISDCILISKKRGMRDTKQIKDIIRVDEFLFIDGEEKR